VDLGYFRLIVSGDDNNLPWCWVMILSILGAGLIVGILILVWAVNKIRKHMKAKRILEDRKKKVKYSHNEDNDNHRYTSEMHSVSNMENDSDHEDREDEKKYKSLIDNRNNRNNKL
jgi:uncharacterized membrane-anchored protein YhcB (DUF1043 family)